MSDELFFSKDNTGLRRGRRGSRRTPVRRPVEFHSVEDPGSTFHGTVADISMGGMRIVSRSWLPSTTKIEFDVKKDVDGLGTTLIKGKAEVVRSDKESDTTYILGVKFLQTETVAQADQRRHVTRRLDTVQPPVSRRASRMHTVDITLGERGRTR